MPSKSAFAATLALCLGLPAAAQALTLPGGAVSSPQGFVLVQQDRGNRASVLRNELDAAKDDLKKAKKSGRGVKAAEQRVQELEDAMAKALGNEPNRRSGGKLGGGDDKDRGQKKKAQDRGDKNKKKAQDRNKGDKNKKKAEDRNKSDKNKKKAEDRPRDNDNKKKADDGGNKRGRDRDNAGRKSDDSRQAKDNDKRKPDKKQSARQDDRDNGRDRNRDRRARRGGGDRGDGVREGNKTSAKELSRKRIEEGQEAFIDGGDRVLRREGGRVVVRSDDRDRFNEGRRRDQRLDGGRTRVVIDRPDGSQVITVRDSNGDIIRRVRRTRDGREIVLINEDEARRGDRSRHGDNRDRDYYRGRDPDRDFRVELGPLRITVPRDRYVVEQRHASRRDLEEALLAPPVEPLRRYYSLEDVRRSDRLRDMMRRIDVSSITFETDSAAISRSQIYTLEELGYVLRSIIDRNPDEVFLIEGHTDAVGSEVYNLALSDRRAESVAIALSDYFGVPPENLVTQGYGEYYLKIPTPYAERENRRVTVRRITPLIRSTQR